MPNRVNLWHPHFCTMKISLDTFSIYDAEHKTGKKQQFHLYFYAKHTGNRVQRKCKRKLLRFTLHFAFAEHLLTLGV